ncbi:MAG: hypothetical protein IPG46_03735 [Actinobacteria bacterium]|nr:hypothetical protein [Actinomycetota bacterium]
MSDDWHAADYVQTKEWPAIARKHDDTSGAFAVLAIAIHRLDDDDPLRSTTFETTAQAR